MNSNSTTEGTTALDIWASHYQQYARSLKRGFPQTDAGNAERFLHRYGHIVAWVPEAKQWIVWNGLHWLWDEHAGVIEGLVIDTMRHAADTEHVLDGGTADVTRWARKSENSHKINNCMALARKQACKPKSELDTDPWLLGVANGTVDLRTGELLPGKPEQDRRDDWITRVVNVEYDPDAEAPTFQSFLDKVQPKDEMQDFIQRALGYSLTGCTGEQVVFIPYGEGSNGKSTLLEAVRGVLGDYVTQANPELLVTSGRSSQHPEALARLDGARLVTVTETENRSRLREGRVKAITGGEPITARFMYGDSFEFQPEFSVWMPVNELPGVTGSDKGIWRRLIPIPFDVVIGDAEKDKALPGKLAEEAAGILAYLVEGAQRWYQRGLEDRPNDVQTARSEYRTEQDHVGRFIDQCIAHDPDAEVMHRYLYDAWRIWCDREGLKPGISAQFGRDLTNHGIARKHTKDGSKRLGVRLTSEWVDEVERERLPF